MESLRESAGVSRWGELERELPKFQKLAMSESSPFHSPYPSGSRGGSDSGADLANLKPGP
jgi:hypothetical protein